MNNIKRLVILILLILSFQQCVFSQNERQYKKWVLKPAKFNIHIDSFSIRSVYNLNKNSILLFGVSEKLYKTGVEVLQYDKKLKKTIFKDYKVGSEDFIYPHFYITDDTLDPVILLCTSGADYTYGVTVYKIIKDKIEKIGYMDLALYVNPDKERDDPQPFIVITTNGKTLTFSFKKSVATNFQNENQKIYKAGQIKYIYENGKFKKQML